MHNMISILVLAVSAATIYTNIEVGVNGQPARFADDVALFRPRRIWNVQRFQDPNNPIREVERSNGNTGRVEYLYAEVTRNHLDRGTVTTQDSRNYVRALGRPNDDAGHIVAQRLGGSGTAEYNLFPQSLNINRGAWAGQEATVAQSLLARNAPRGAMAKMYFRFNYPNDRVNRPTSLDYMFMYPGGARIVSNIVNP